MVRETEVLEREFEETLIDVLSQDYDLAVRHAEDRIERRKQGIARLDFEYQYSGDRSGKVIVSIDGAPQFSSVLPVDLTNTEAATRSAEDCEALALFLMEYLGAQDDELFAAFASGDLDYGRREEDL